MIAKLGVVEDRAAANMLVEALSSLGSGDSCLVDAGDPGAGNVPPGSRSELRDAETIYVVGGPAAIPDTWLTQTLKVGNWTRIAGGNRWATQSAVADAIVSLALGESLIEYSGQTSGNATLPPNVDCSNDSVAAKLVVIEDRAAANMLVEALRTLSGDTNQRCLVDAGSPDSGFEPSQVSRDEIAGSSYTYVIGGSVAIPDRWIAEHFAIDQFRRLAGSDRWETQAIVARAIVTLAGASTGANISVEDLYPERIAAFLDSAENASRGVSIADTAADSSRTDRCEEPSRDEPADRRSEVEILHSDSLSGKLYFCYQALNGRSVQQARLQIASADSSVVAVDVIPVYTLDSGGVPNDANARVSQWHLHSQHGIDATQLHADYPQEAAEVIVAVLDSGINRDHPALQGAIIESSDEECVAARDDREDMHGTHVAGIIASRRINLGIVGVAPHSKILPLGLLASDSRHTQREHIELECALASNARVINMSYSWENTQGEFVLNDGTTHTTRELYFRHFARGNPDVVFVSSSGNCGNEDHYRREGEHNGCVMHNQLRFPQGFDSVIGVAASTRDGKRASFSSANGSVDLAAPGHNIVSTVEDDKVGSKNGTSQAAPVVSAVVAHMIAHCPSATREDIREALEQTAGDGDGVRNDDELGFGIVRPLDAIQFLKEPGQPCGPSLQPPTVPRSVILEMGADARSEPNCRSNNEHCRWLQVRLEGFAGQTHRVQCSHGASSAQTWWTGDVDFGPQSLSERACYFGLEGEEVFVVVDGEESNRCIWRTGGPCDNRPVETSVRIGWGFDASGRGSCSSGSNCRNLTYDIRDISQPYTLGCRSNSPSEPDWTGSWSGRAHTGCYFRPRGGGDYDVWVTVNGVESNRISTSGIPRQPPSGNVRIGWGFDASGRGSCSSGSNCRNLTYDIRDISQPYTLGCRSNSPSEPDWTGSWSGRAHTGCYFRPRGGGDYDVWVTVNGVESNRISTSGIPR